MNIPLKIDFAVAEPSRFPCCVLSYFSLVFVVEHSRQIQVTRVSWVLGQSTMLNQTFFSSKNNRLRFVPKHHIKSFFQGNVCKGGSECAKLYLMTARIFTCHMRIWKVKEACNEHLFLLSDANGAIRDKLLKCQQHTESSNLIFAQKSGWISLTDYSPTRKMLFNDCERTQGTN